MAERRTAEESPLTGIGTAAMAVPIPIVQAAGAALAIAGKAIQAGDQKAIDTRYDSVVRVEDEQESTLASGKAEEINKKRGLDINKETVFSAEGGKMISPREIYLKNKYDVGGVPQELPSASPLGAQIPIKPERQINTPIEFTKGVTNTNTGPVNDSQSTLDAVLGEAATITGTAFTQASNAKKMGGDKGVTGGMFKNMNTTENQQLLNAGTAVTGVPMSTGGLVVGEGDGSGVDDAIPTNLQDDGGFLIRAESVDAAKKDGVMKAAGHVEGQIADVNKTSEADANAMISSNEYYLTEKEAQDLTAKGINLDKYAPESDKKMNAATGGWLDGLGNFLSRRTSEGFREKNYKRNVRDYRGEVSEGTEYNPDDPASIPTIKDWYQAHSEYYNPTGGTGVGFNRQEFKEANMNLQDVSEEYNKWMEENRSDTYSKYEKEDSSGKGKNSAKGSSSTNSFGGSDSIINDLTEWNKKYKNLYGALTGVTAATEVGKLMLNNEASFSPMQSQELGVGDYPIPALTGSKNLINQMMGGASTQRQTDKTSDLASNMISYAASKVTELEQGRKAMGEVLNRQDDAKMKKFEYEEGIKAENAKLAGETDKLNMLLSSAYNEKKGQVMSENADAALDAFEDQAKVAKEGKQTEFALRSALETQRTFQAGQAYNTLLAQLGDDFPAKWAGMTGMNLFMTNYYTPEYQEEIRVLLEGVNVTPPKSDPPPSEANPPKPD